MYREVLTKEEEITCHLTVSKLMAATRPPFGYWGGERQPQKRLSLGGQPSLPHLSAISSLFAILGIH